MIPFSLKVFCLRVFMWALKLVTRILPVRQPDLFVGEGAALKLVDHFARSGVKRLLLVTDAMLIKLGLLDAIQARLAFHQIQVTVYDGIEPDPSIEQIEAGLTLLQSHDCTAILAVGGGSSMDAAKVIAARATNPHKIRWMAGKLRVLFKPLPLYVIPTTSGTGSEVTIAAVVSDPANTRKFAIMDPALVPQGAALDPRLTQGLPPAITAATGMDALTHAIEAYISHNHLPETDFYALEAVRLISEFLPRVMDNGADLHAREQMALASYKAGAAFTKAGVGYVHAIAHNFGARYHIPHGLANAIVLPHVLEFSKPACLKRLADLARVSGLARETLRDDELADAFIAHIRALNQRFGIPAKVEPLKAADIPLIAQAAIAEARWTYAVPRYLTPAQCEALIAQMLPAAS